MFARARIVCLRRPNERADGCSKVVVLTQIKQHLVQVLTSHPLAAHIYSLSLSYIHFISPCDNTDNGNVTCARPPTGNIAMRTPRMQIHSDMHFNANYGDTSFSETLWLNQRRAVMSLPIGCFGLNYVPAILQ